MFTPVEKIVRQKSENAIQKIFLNENEFLYKCSLVLVGYSDHTYAIRNNL